MCAIPWGREGIDLFAYTKEEFERLRGTSAGWYEAIRSGIRI
jgi:hypothetical protein